MIWAYPRIRLATRIPGTLSSPPTIPTATAISKTSYPVLIEMMPRGRMTMAATEAIAEPKAKLRAAVKSDFIPRAKLYMEECLEYFPQDKPLMLEEFGWSRTIVTSRKCSGKNNCCTIVWIHSRLDHR
jgi:hypothetical protein